ncbi:MAG TPA: 50S ribosomal protein L25 [Synergistales bacterium]|nr:50S ribosomal protein L25 [Synergistales bacterium]HPK42122.1 50S ribosomal protein L25 [Synergistales bacterium]
MDKSTRIRLEKREETGKQHCKKVRNEGKIPGVLYGPGYLGSLPFYVAVQSIAPIVQSGRWETARLDVETPGGKKELCLMRDLQRNPLTGSILHVDLLQLKKGHKVSVNVPVEITGREKCAGVKQGGIFEQLIHEVEMEVLPSEIPASIAIDVTGLSLDGAIRIADVKFPESAVLTLSPEEVIVTIAQPRVEVEAAPEAAEEETTEVEVVTKGKAKEEEV